MNNAETNEPSPITLIKFSASWCGPCKLLANNLGKILNEYPFVKLREIDIDDHPELAKRYAIKSVPTLVIEVAGKEIDRLIGAVKIDSLRHAMQLAHEGAETLLESKDHFPALNTSRRQGQANQVMGNHMLP